MNIALHYRRLRILLNHSIAIATRTDQVDSISAVGNVFFCFSFTHCVSPSLCSQCSVFFSLFLFFASPSSAVLQHSASVAQHFCVFFSPMCIFSLQKISIASISVLDGVQKATRVRKSPLCET